jgi:hypothetical protein
VSRQVSKKSVKPIPMQSLLTLILAGLGTFAFGQQVPGTPTTAAVNSGFVKKMQPHNKRFTNFITNSTKKIYEESFADDAFNFEAAPLMEMNRLAGYATEPEKEIYEKLKEVRKRQHESEQRLREKKFRQHISKATVAILYM